MNEINAVETLKKIAIEASYVTERMKAMEALGEMGERGVAALSEVASKGRFYDEREKALDLVKKSLKEIDNANK